MVNTKPSVSLKIIKILYSHGGSATIDDLIKELQLPRNYVHSYLSILVKKNVIERVKTSDNKILYTLVKS
jgi:uncharacterized membrane protein